MSVITYKWAQGPRIISHNMSSWPGASMRSLRGESGSHILNLDIWRCLVMIQRCVVIWSSPHLFVNLLAASCPNSGDADLRKPDTLLLRAAAQSLNNATNLTTMQNCMCVNCIFGALRNATIKSSWHVFWSNCSLWHISLRRVPSHVFSVLYFYSLAHWASLGWVGAFLLVWCFVSRLSQGSPGRMSLQ